MKHRAEVVQSIQQFFRDHSAPVDEESVCERCGKSTEHLDLTFWLYETESRCDLRMPLCTCESDGRDSEKSGSNAQVIALPKGSDWRELYQAALIERDGHELLQRILEAQISLNLRARELFHAKSEQMEERRSVDAAMHSLQALRMTCTKSGKKVKPSDSEESRIA
jgi:hypothetical protein